MTPVVTFVGDSALVAEFDDRIDEDVNDHVVGCARAIADRRVPGVRDIVPTFRSVTVYFDPLKTEVTALTGVVEQSLAEPVLIVDAARRLVEIPVCYDTDFGLDLQELATFSGLPVDGVIAAHPAHAYRVYRLGFLPGFAYRGAVDPRIAAPRRSTPRLRVPPGSVGIAGQQTGIYPVATPGGWNIVGRTPLRLAVDIEHELTPLHCGDSVRFVPIDRPTFDVIAAKQGFDA